MPYGQKTLCSLKLEPLNLLKVYDTYCMFGKPNTFQLFIFNGIGVGWKTCLNNHILLLLKTRCIFVYLIILNRFEVNVI